MTCKEKDIKALLPAYLEGAVVPSENELIEAHLASCEDCRAELGLLRSMAGEPVPDPGEAFWSRMPSRVFQEIGELRKERRPVFAALWRAVSLPPWAGAAAAVTVVVLLAWLLVRPAHKEPSVALLPVNGDSSEDVVSLESMDVESLPTDEFTGVGEWADSQMASLKTEAADVLVNGGPEKNLYDELAEMDERSLERFSTMLDRLKREG